MSKLMKLFVIIRGVILFVIARQIALWGSRQINKKWQPFMNSVFDTKSNTITGELQSCTYCNNKVAKELGITYKGQFFCNKDCATHYYS